MATDSASPPTPPREREGNRITRVYTRSGDRGLTGLVGGQRVSKDSVRIEAYGTVDELSALLGLARLEAERETCRFTEPTDAETLASHLEFIQNQLFTLGGDLATRVEDRHPLMPVITEEHVGYLERLCDAFNGQLPPLKDFVLAGGTRTGATLQHARTVCRRAERCVVALSHVEETGDAAQSYINRLSDVLFVLARWANQRMEAGEAIWRRDLPEPPMPSEKEGGTA